MAACAHKMLDGSGCKARPQSKSKFCFFHDPKKVKERQKAHASGGSKAQSKRRHVEYALPEETPDVALETVGDVLEACRATINHVRRGQLDTKVADTVSRTLGVALRALEANDTDNRIKKLEEQFRPLKDLSADKLIEIVRAGQANGETSPTGH